MNCDPGVKSNFVHLTEILITFVMLRNIKRRLSVGRIKKRIVGGYNGDHVSLSRKISSTFS